MPRYRMLYAKGGPARYISHLDLLRTFERAARRAGLPLAFTRGFNPHPKITFAAPLGVGIAGEAEYVDMEFTEYIPEAEVAGALSRALPQGLRLINVKTVPERAPSLMAVVGRATYRAEAKLARTISVEELKTAIDAFLDMPEILVERKNKVGKKKKRDIRPGIFAMSGRLSNDTIIIEAELKTGSSGNVRIEEVLAAFENNSRLPVEGGFILYRTGLYAEKEKEDKDQL